MSVSVSIEHDFGGFMLDAQFQIERPGITALFGPSGAGKTSVINAVAGLLRPQKGRILLGDRVVFDSGVPCFVPPEKRSAGYVFQNARLFPHMSVERNLRFGWRRASRQASQAEVQRMVLMLDLAPLLKRKPGNLSGGEKGRVALGRALLSSPEILLLDEPLAALDQARKTEILPFLERLRDETGLPMIYVSHSLEEVSRLADQVILMRNGRTAASGPVFDVLTEFGTVLDASIVAHDPIGRVTMLEFPGGRLTIPLLSRPAGTRLRVRIPAEDVMVALQEPQGISANNILPVLIAGIHASESYADLRLACGPSVFAARITRASLARLALVQGMQLFAIVKSVTVAPQIDRASTS